MATGVNYWSADEPSYKVSQCVWGGEQESSSEEGGGGVTWDTPVMEVKGQLISAPDRKLSQRMAELHERRRGLQALLSVRLAELRRICLQEAELTGAVPREFPLEPGERPPCVRWRGGRCRQGNRKCKEEEDCRSKPKKTLFSGALRKHSDPEHNTHTQTHTYHSKRTVHRGCHTDEVRSESSSTSDSAGADNDEGLPQCRPPLVPTGSPAEVFYQSKTSRNRSDHPGTVYTHKPPTLLPCHPPSLPHHPPPRSQDSSSSGFSDPGASGEVGVRVNGTHRSNSSDGLLDRITPPEGEGGGQQGGLWVNGWPGSRGTNTAGVFRSSETLSDGRTRPTEGAARGGGGGHFLGGRGGGYSEVLLDYVWGKQQQQREQPLYNGYSSQQPPGAPPTYHGHHSDQRRVKVTRTKSCGPFLSSQQSQTDSQTPPLSSIQPDPHPHLLPPRPPQLPLNQDAQLEEATRSLHKALALEGLRDWYLRNTQQSQAGGKVNSGASTKVNGGVKGQAHVGGALQRRRTTHGIVQPAACRSEAHRHHKQTLPHSATFHGRPLQARSAESSLYDSFPQKQEVPLRETAVDQPSPGTLV